MAAVHSITTASGPAVSSPLMLTSGEDDCREAELQGADDRRGAAGVGTHRGHGQCGCIAEDQAERAHDHEQRRGR